MSTVTTRDEAKKTRKRSVGSTGDKTFRGFAYGAGIAILVLLGAVAFFLLLQSYQVYTASMEEIQEDVGFAQVGSEPLSFWGYAARALFGTVLSALMALAIAVPLAIGIALFISHFAPRRLAQLLGYIIDLLAAIPSIIFGMWGMWTLEPLMKPIFTWMEDYLRPIIVFFTGDSEMVDGEEVWSGGLPFLAYPAENWEWWPIQPDVLTVSAGPARNIAMGAVILAIMILPIITSLCREVFIQTPRLQEEAAMALGATRWEMIKMTVLPMGRSGMVSAAMLGLGRALGETMALLMVLSAGLQINFNVFSVGQHSTIASQIALRWPEASAGTAENPSLEQPFLIALGLLLFVLTFIVNFIARGIVNRRKEFSGANA